MGDSPPRLAHIQYAGKELRILAPYDADFVSELKKGTVSRRWDPRGKKWTLNMREREQALAIVRRHYQVSEDDQPAGEASAGTGLDHASFSVKPGDSVQVWTDGSCLGNPGPGAYAIIMTNGSGRTERMGGYRVTTNNRMELMGPIAALEALPAGCTVTIFSDSRYLVDSMTRGWATRWRANNWKKKPGGQVPNTDLWERLLRACEAHRVEFIWVKGHDSQPENERCNTMAVAFAGTAGLPADEGYTLSAPADH